MPRIPTQYSTASILTGGNASASSPESFGFNPAAPLARAAQDVSDGLFLNAKAKQQIKKVSSDKENALWASKNASAIARTATDFEVNPVNRSRPDYLPSWMKHVDDATSTARESAPSPEAAEMLDAEVSSYVDRKYPSAAGLSAENEMMEDIGTLDQNWSDAITNYHKIAAVDKASAEIGLMADLDDSTLSIMRMYHDVAPQLEKKMMAQKFEDAILATAHPNPPLANGLLKNASGLLGQEKVTALQRQIDIAKETGMLQAKEDFRHQRETLIIGAVSKGANMEFPLTDYAALYTGEEAAIQKQRDDRQVKAAVEAHGFVKETAGQFPGERYAAQEKYAASLTTPEQLEMLTKVVLPAVNRDTELYQKDGVQWLQENNPVIKALKKEEAILAGNATGEDGTSFDGSPGVLPPLVGPIDVNAANNAKLKTYKATLRYQGLPQDGEDPKLFMGKPRSEQHLLTVGEANYYARHLNGGDIDAVVANVKGILDKYPDDALRAQVIQDLATLPKEPIKPEYQLVFQNADQPWLPQFIGNIRGAKDLEKVAEVDKTLLSASIKSSKVWQSFRNSIIGPQNSRATDVEGFYQAIELNAKGMMVANGLKPADAANKSIEQLLNSSMKPVEVSRAGFSSSSKLNSDYGFWRSDPEIWLPRTPQGFDKPLTDVELDNYGERMGTALANIHPDDVDISQFANLKQYGDSEKQKQLIHQNIVEFGRYYPEPGGAYYRITVPAAGGGRQDLRNKDGKFFRLNLKSLPKYEKMGLHWKGLELKGLSPDTWSLKETPEFKDYPEDLNSDGYPVTGKFWEYTK